MSVGARNKKGLFVDRFNAVTNMMNYRGIAENDKDVPSFRQKMAKKGHIVLASDEPIEKHSITKQDNKDFVIDYPSCFNDQMDTLFPKG
jgi:hypothetical protein